MTKKMAIALVVFMLAIVAWGVFVEGGATRIIINGHELAGPFKGAVGAAGLLVASVAFFCAAIFLLFVVAGAGLFVLGCVIAVGLILAGLAFPFLLLVLIPLAIVWVFIAIARHKS
ncbi:MAG TPA: hypothetical protein VI298_16820 [Geobacteraceae bacterium]